jgi:hypothetical protein
MCDMQSYGIDDDLLSYLPRHSQGVDSHHSRDVSDGRTILGSAVLEYPTTRRDCVQSKVAQLFSTSTSKFVHWYNVPTKRISWIALESVA